MFEAGLQLFAEIAPVASAAAPKYRLSQWQAYTEWWQAPLLVVVSLVIVAFVVAMYRRDSVELRPGVGWFLLLMRLGAFVGLLLFYLNLEKWSEQKEIQNSRAVVLVDTSISMALEDADTSAAGPSASRGAQVVNQFTAGPLLDDLRKVHDVAVWRFDEDLGRVALLPEHEDAARREQLDKTAQAASQTRLRWLRWVLAGALGLILLATLGWIFQRFLLRRPRTHWIWGLAAGLSAALFFGALAWLNLTNPTADLIALVGLREGSPGAAAAASVESEPVRPESKPVDWADALKPRGIETRLGQSLRQLIGDERSGPISGVVVFTDGGQNAGIDPAAAIEAAREAKIPIYLVGLGSDRRPTNVRIADLGVPVRAYPGDSFVVTADLEAQGMAGRQVVVELASRPAGKAGRNSAWNVEAQQPVTLPTDGKQDRVKFELPGIKETGRRTLQLRVKVPGDAKNAKDHEQEADIEIVDRKNRVLLIAGGPTREYQFLRNLLRRDRDTIVDVLLQTAQPGISQEANQILDSFPGTMKELREYDTIVAFDPDWRALDSDPAQNGVRIDLLEQWVAEEAGGLIVIAGPVYTDDWVQDPGMSKIRGLYPVEFNRRLVQAKDSKYGSEQPGPLEFTREGIEAEFLWLDSSAATSARIWAGFKGVYGYFQVRDKKPGATIYARYADPDLSAVGDQLPIYMAGQLYGSGRVFYLGSGEMWRLREMDETYFDQIYTKLIRHVSQGRLLRGSRRGNLTVDRDSYLLGNTVDVQARVTDVQHQPLTLPKLTAEVTPQQGAPLMVSLLADPSRRGMYRGQFTVLEAGPHRIELPLPDSVEEPLTRQFMVKVPELERDNPQRNDALMSEIARRTGGRYYVGMQAALGQAGVPAVAGELKDQTRETPKTGDLDKQWQQLWMTWLLCGICGCLCLEWLVRRLSRLA